MTSIIQNRCHGCKSIVSLKDTYCKKCKEPIQICEICKNKVAKFQCMECMKYVCIYCGLDYLCDDCS